MSPLLHLIQRPPYRWLRPIRGNIVCRQELRSGGSFSEVKYDSANSEYREQCDQHFHPAPDIRVAIVTASLRGI
jgi:hypothetical protein